MFCLDDIGENVTNYGWLIMDNIISNSFTHYGNKYNYSRKMVDQMVLISVA